MHVGSVAEPAQLDVQILRPVTTMQVHRVTMAVVTYPMDVLIQQRVITTQWLPVMTDPATM
jgi:hypothetical protein